MSEGDTRGGGQHGLVAQEESGGGNIGRGAAQKQAEYWEGGSMAWLHRRNLGEGILGGGQHGLVAQEESGGGNIGRGAAQKEAEYWEGGSMAWLHRRNLGEGILKPDGGSMLTQYWPR